MRIVAGRWRGRRLQAPKGEQVRPTTDRVKEALFNILGDDVRGAVVLDLCCGSGGLGIEALSRGAAKVYFVDRAVPSLRTAKSNLELCGADPDSYDLVRAEAAAWLGAWLAGPERPRRWLALADPPYASDAGQAILEALTVADDPTDPLWVVIEHRKGEGPSEPDPESWTNRRRTYGESELLILQPIRH